MTHCFRGFEDGVLEHSRGAGWDEGAQSRGVVMGLDHGAGSFSVKASAVYASAWTMRSASISVGRLVLARGTTGIIDASAT